MEKIVWEVTPFEGLDTDSLYKILRLRSEVFVVEQDSAYLDLDGKDQKSWHLQGFLGDELVAYCRLFKAGDYLDEACIGRVVVPLKHRKAGYGDMLMKKAIELMSALLHEQNITISAQLYLQSFYESHGFEKQSDTYLEDKIPHIRMKRKIILD